MAKKTPSAPSRKATPPRRESAKQKRKRAFEATLTHLEYLVAMSKPTRGR